jgi:hypothetical protein
MSPLSSPPVVATPGDRFAIAVIEGGAIRTRRHAEDLPQTKN